MKLCDEKFHLSDSNDSEFFESHQYHTSISIQCVMLAKAGDDDGNKKTARGCLAVFKSLMIGVLILPPLSWRGAFWLLALQPVRLR